MSARQNNRSKKSQTSKIPKTGRIGQWVRAIEDEGVSQSVLEAIMQNVNQFTSTSNPVKKSDWIKGATERLENSVNNRTCMKIMETRGRICCGSTLRKLAKKLINSTKGKIIKVKLHIRKPLVLDM